MMIDFSASEIFESPVYKEALRRCAEKLEVLRSTIETSNDPHVIMSCVKEISGIEYMNNIVLEMVQSELSEQ